MGGNNGAVWQAALLAASLLGCSPPAERPGPAAQPAVASPEMFTEVARELNVQFRHDSGSIGEYRMPEHIGSGVALFDYNNDGRLDLYWIQCGGPQSTARNQLYRQGPDGTFENVSEGSGLDVAGMGMGATAGDLNNDGWTDLVVTEYGRVRVFKNEGGARFQEVTSSAGVENARWATAASLLDYDRDGWLDLVIGNYVDYHPDQQCLDPAGAREFCGPQDFQTTVSRLFRNRGAVGNSPTPSFEDVTVRSGLAKAKGKVLGILCADFDGDRWPDIFMADDGVPNRLYINRKDGQWVEEAMIRGIGYSGMGAVAGNMGIGLGDVNADGMFDLFVTHLTHEQHALWTQGPRGFFQDQTAGFGLAQLPLRGTGFGTALVDFDLDGWPDLAVVNGSIRRGSAHPGTPLAGLIPFWHPYAQGYQLFVNRGQGGFADVSSSNRSFCGFTAIGRGLAYGDIDNDGDIDLVAVCAGGPGQIFRNSVARRGHWLTIRALLETRFGARDALGAEVIVLAQGQKWWRLIQPSTSYLVSNDPRAHFGLGPASRVEAIQVLWPDGSEESFPGVASDQHILLRKGSGRQP